MVQSYSQPEEIESPTLIHSEAPSHRHISYRIVNVLRLITYFDYITQVYSPVYQYSESHTSIPYKCNPFVLPNTPHLNKSSHICKITGTNRQPEGEFEVLGLGMAFSALYMWCNRDLHCELFFPSISKFFGTERSYVVGGWPADDEGLGRVKVTDFTHTTDSFS